jgi:hypothetical protein
MLRHIVIEEKSGGVSLMLFVLAEGYSVSIPEEEWDLVRGTMTKAGVSVEE